MSRLLIVCLVLACSGGNCELDPTPTLSYRPGAMDGGQSPLATDTFELEAGDTHICAAIGATFFGDEFSRPRCWGGNERDQLSRRGSPDIGEAWWFDNFRENATMAVGAAHACFAPEEFEYEEGDEPEDPGDGPLRCWGNNVAAQLGVPADTEVIGIQGPTLLRAALFVDVAVGALHGCFTDGLDIFCWGDNSAGQRGAETDCCEITTRVEPPEEWEGWAQLAAGSRHTCALQPIDEGGRLVCWGDDSFGQLGDGAAVSTTMTEVGDGFVDVAAGPHHTCAIDSDGDVFCWGRNDSGELGTGEASDAPVRVELPVRAERIFAGGQSGLTIDDENVSFVAGAATTCALDVDGQAYCWGANESGQLGPGLEVLAPTAIHPTLRFDRLALGGAFTCGVLRDSPEVWCWGNNDVGQLGREGGSSPEPALADVLFEQDGTAIL